VCCQIATPSFVGLARLLRPGNDAPMTVIATARHEAGSNLLLNAVSRHCDREARSGKQSVASCNTSFNQSSVCGQIAMPSFAGLAMTLRISNKKSAIPKNSAFF